MGLSKTGRQAPFQIKFTLKIEKGQPLEFGCRAGGKIRFCAVCAVCVGDYFGFA
jgi:hypothetical protein